MYRLFHNKPKVKNYVHLHFLVFIAGFTAILGELITIKAIPLVWYRMVIASILMFIYIKVAKVKLKNHSKISSPTFNSWNHNSFTLDHFFWCYRRI